MSILITGTDTGVGKSAVSAALIRLARRAGLRVGGMKPAESGCERRGDELLPADALLLRAAAGGGDPLDLVCPFRLEAPLAPGIAALREGVEMDLARVERAYGALRERHPDGLVVEGAGGLLVPLEPAFSTVADLALRLGLPVLVVARPTLGTINHSTLTVEALARRGIACRGVVLNGVAPGEEDAADTNARAIERLAGVPVLATLPRMEARGGLALAEALADELQGRELDPAGLLF